MADERLEDARVLLGGSRWSAAYYISGYALECGLKSCVIRFVENHPDIIFADREYSKKCWTHDIENLLRLADLKPNLDNDIGNNPRLFYKWSIAKGWNETVRYRTVVETDARNLFDAISDTQDGVLQWIRQYW